MKQPLGSFTPWGPRAYRQHRVKRCPCCGGPHQRCERKRTRIIEDIAEKTEPVVTEHTIHRNRAYPVGRRVVVSEAGRPGDVDPGAPGGEYDLIRRKHLIDGMSLRAISRELGHARNTVAKATANPIPPGLPAQPTPGPAHDRSGQAHRRRRQNLRHH